MDEKEVREILDDFFARCAVNAGHNGQQLILR